MAVDLNIMEGRKQTSGIVEFNREVDCESGIGDDGHGVQEIFRAPLRSREDGFPRVSMSREYGTSSRFDRLQLNFLKTIFSAVCDLLDSPQASGHGGQRTS